MVGVFAAVKTAAAVTAAMETSAVRSPAAAAAASKHGLAREGDEQEEYQRKCGAEPPHDSQSTDENR